MADASSVVADGYAVPYELEPATAPAPAPAPVELEPEPVDDELEDEVEDEGDLIPGTHKGAGHYEAEDGTRWRGADNAPAGYYSATEA